MVVPGGLVVQRRGGLYTLGLQSGLLRRLGRIRVRKISRRTVTQQAGPVEALSSTGRYLALGSISGGLVVRSIQTSLGSGASAELGRCTSVANRAPQS